MVRVLLYMKLKGLCSLIVRRSPVMFLAWALYWALRIDFNEYVERPQITPTSNLLSGSSFEASSAGLFPH